MQETAATGTGDALDNRHADPNDSGVSEGVYLVDKPEGPSSFRMVQLVRRALSIKKVGHAGTLDPFASGLLVICVGRSSTRHISRLMEGEKEYEATMVLGVETDTQDREGNVIATRPVGDLQRDIVGTCLARFVGELEQVPPAFSALKHKGKPLYHYARKGIEIPREPRRISIRSIELIEHAGDTLRIRVICSKGTYIRTLASDIGHLLGCGAHLVALRRLRSGDFSVDDALDGGMLADRDEARQLLLQHRLTVDDVLKPLTTE